MAPAELVNAFRNKTRYFNTFASSPLQAAVGQAVIDVIEQEGLLSSVAAVGSHLRDNLRAIQESCEPIGDVRGRAYSSASSGSRTATARSPIRRART